MDSSNGSALEGNLSGSPKKANGKVPNGTITRNFFEVEELDGDDVVQTSSPTKLLDSNSNKNKPSHRETLKNKRSIKLKPLNQADSHAIELPSLTKIQKNQENPEKKQQQKIANKASKLNFQIESSQNSEQQQIQQIKKAAFLPKNQPQPKKQQKKPAARQPEPQTISPENSDNEPVQHPHNNAQSSSPQPINQHPSPAQTSTNPVTNHEPPRPLTLTNCKIYTMRRDNSWLNKLWPQYHLSEQANNLYCFSAKMTGKNKDITFIVCENKENFVENGEDYVGKVKANFIGSLLNIFGPGYNPSDYKNKKQPIRQIQATVQYETNFFGSTRPRNFKVYALKQGLSYYDDLEGTTRGQEEIPLSQLYDRGDNKQKIHVMQNRKPQWNENIKGYMLNFGGRVKIASIKNFILEDQGGNHSVRMIFGKVDDDQYRLDIGDPLSPLIGFGVALSTFGGKIGCE